MWELVDQDLVVMLVFCIVGFLPLDSLCSANLLVVLRWLGMLYGGL